MEAVFDAVISFLCLTVHLSKAVELNVQKFYRLGFTGVPTFKVPKVNTMWVLKPSPWVSLFAVGICLMVTQYFFKLIQQNLSENTETSENFPKVFSAQSWPTLSDLMDCSPPGSSVPGIPQARIWEWVAISFSRGSS